MFSLIVIFVCELGINLFVYTCFFLKKNNLGNKMNEFNVQQIKD